MPCWVDGIWMGITRSTYPAFSRTDRKRLLDRATRDFIDAFMRLPKLQKASLWSWSPNARVGRSMVYRWIERYLAEQAPSALADGNDPIVRARPWAHCMSRRTRISVGCG